MNYYLYTNKTEIAFGVLQCHKFGTAPRCGYSVHICKIVEGWKPLFQQQNFIDTVSDLKRVLKHNPDICIIDENGELVKIQEFFEKVKTNGNSHKRLDTQFYSDGEYEWTEGEFE